MAGTSTLLWGVLFGAIGLGYFTYGTRQKAAIPLVVGAALFIIPYVITNVYWLVLAGLILAVLPYFVRL